MTPQAQEISPEDLFSEFKRSGDKSTLDALIASQIGYVRFLVSHVPNYAHEVLDFDDLVQCGLIAVLDAAQSYDGQKGVPFKTWIGIKVKWAIRDAIRALSSTSRSRDIHFIALEDVYPFEDNVEMIDSLLSPKTSSTLRKALMDLPLRQSFILLFSMHGLPVSAIAGLLDISHSLVAKERRSALELLRAQLISAIGEQRKA